MIDYSIDATTRTQVKRAALALRVRASVSYYVICIRSKPQKPDYASLLRARNIPFGHFRTGLCSRPSLSSLARFLLGGSGDETNPLHLTTSISQCLSDRYYMWQSSTIKAC